MCTNPCGSSSRDSRLKISTAAASSTWCRKLLTRMKSNHPSPSPVYSTDVYRQELATVSAAARKRDMPH